MCDTYFPKHDENRMKNEGDVDSARKFFMTGKNRILFYLIQQRFSWMNEYIKPTDEVVVELGCGAGLSKQFIAHKNFVLTDVVKHDWVDKYLDAANIDYPDNSIDVIICSHMIHHISNPASFLDSVSKKLKVGGRLIIQDIYTCTLMKMALRLMRHEGWSDTVDVFSRSAVCNDPIDPWSANCSIPKLLFMGGVFEKQFPAFKIIKHELNECLLFFTSGGVIAKTFYLPAGDGVAKIIQKIDKALVKIAPSFFACGCSVVLERDS